MFTHFKHHLLCVCLGGGKGHWMFWKCWGWVLLCVSQRDCCVQGLQAPDSCQAGEDDVVSLLGHVSSIPLPELLRVQLQGNTHLAHWDACSTGYVRGHVIYTRHGQLGCRPKCKHCLTSQWWVFVFAYVSVWTSVFYKHCVCACMTEQARKLNKHFVRPMKKRWSFWKVIIWYTS